MKNTASREIMIPGIGPENRECNIIK